MATTTRRGTRATAAAGVSPVTGGITTRRTRQTPIQSNSPMLPTPPAKMTTTPGTASQRQQQQQQQIPVRSADSCKLCTVPITINDKSVIKCDICHEHYHQKCTNLPADVFTKLVAIVNITGWACSSCREAARSVIDKTQSAIAVISEQIAEMKQSIDEIRTSGGSNSNADVVDNNNASDDNNNNQRSALKTETAIIVHRTLADISKRRKNVVLSGLPEKANDRQAFLEICETHLTVKPIVSDSDCIRLGPPRTDRPRLLLVKLRSEDTAAEILRAAPRLRRCSDEDVARSVYINRDLSREASKAEYERRQRRRADKRRKEEDAGSTETVAAVPADGQHEHEHEQHTNVEAITDSVSTTVSTAAAGRPSSPC